VVTIVAVYAPGDKGILDSGVNRETIEGVSRGRHLMGMWRISLSLAESTVRHGVMHKDWRGIMMSPWIVDEIVRWVALLALKPDIKCATVRTRLFPRSIPPMEHDDVVLL